MRSLRRLAILLVAAAALAGCAVTPTVQWQHSTFEGFDVISYVPEQPRGLVFFFHGTNGSANFATRLESTDVLNRLTARGYGFVSTSSTERTGDQRWNAANASLTTNPDLARLLRLRSHLIATTPVESSTPLVGVGMSNGARFVTLWGQSWKNAGYPVKAIWASHGRTAAPFDGQGQLTVPVFFSASQNDFTVPPGSVLQSAITANDSGTPTEFYLTKERRLSAPVYERIPEVDANEGKQIVQALIATGAWDAQGDRAIADIQQAVVRASTVNLPASVRPQASSIGDETAWQLAVHQFTAEYAQQAIAFFDRYVP